MKTILSKKYKIGLFGKYINSREFEKNFQKIFKKCKFYYLSEHEHYKKIVNKKIDIVISYGYGVIFKNDFFKKNQSCKIINMHIGYLPHGRGIYPNMFSIIENKKCGYSTHLIKNIKIDAGPLLHRKEILYTNRDTLKTIFDKTKKSLDKFILKNLRKIIFKKSKVYFRRYYKYNNRKKANQYFRKLPCGWNTNIDSLKKIKF